MVQLAILSGKKAGEIHNLRQFPCVIGRGTQCDLRIEEPGIWERHLRLEFGKDQLFTFSTFPQAKTSLNRCPVDGGILRSGDLIEAGAIKLQFWLAPARQQSLRVREGLTWAGLLGLCIGQAALVYQLLR